jgi:FkbM family methyltransferase
MFQIDRVKFRCIDSESIKILSPEYESCLWKHLNLKKGDVFIDVGAHIGKYTITAAKIVGKSGLVVSLEPFPANYRTLLENIKMNKLTNVVALNVAVWDAKCDLKLFIGREHGQHSVKKDSGRGFITVQANTLDNIVSTLGVEKVNVIKIDVEGAEAEVIKGSIRILNKYHPKLIIEVWDPASIKELANEIGYNMKQIDKYHYLFTR